MLAFLLSPSFRPFIIPIVVLAFIPAAMLYAFNAGRNAERVAVLKAEVEAYKARNKVDEKVAGFDDVAICLRLGGMPDECDQLRGLD